MSKNINLNCTNDDSKIEMALFKFSVIAPLITEQHDCVSNMEFFRTAALKEYTLPNGKNATFSHTTIKSWYVKFKKQGNLEALITKSRKDFGNSRALPLCAHTRIFELKSKFPHITGKAIYQKLIEEGVINAKDASIASIYRFLKSNELKNIPTVERRAFEMEHSNDCWQCDTSHGPVINADGKKVQTYLVQIIDDASRLIVGHEFFFNDNALNFQTVLKQAVTTYGIPKKIFVDNGKPYQNLQFKIICANLGSVLIYARPYSPESKGKIERSFRTIKDNFLNCTDWNSFKSLDDLNERYSNYLNEKYNNSLHSSINDVPRKRFMKDFDMLKKLPKEQIDIIFLHTVQRKVLSDATIKLNTITFEVPQKYIKQNIQVKYHPNNLNVAYIYDENGNLKEEIYPIDKLANSKAKRAELSFENMRGDNINV